VIFELAHTSEHKYSYSVLYSFCAQANCADGSYPLGTLIVDASGDLYGIASQGGAQGDGEAFELAPNGGAWTLQVVHSFCSQPDCADGMQPFAGLTHAGASSGESYNGTSPLYGTTTVGGSQYGALPISFNRARMAGTSRSSIISAPYPIAATAIIWRRPLSRTHPEIFMVRQMLAETARTMERSSS
jgi:uncharacterized repeat protein (TIGR03803 family)